MERVFCRSKRSRASVKIWGFTRIGPGPASDIFCSRMRAFAIAWERSTLWSLFTAISWRFPHGSRNRAGTPSLVYISSSICGWPDPPWKANKKQKSKNSLFSGFSHFLSRHFPALRVEHAGEDQPAKATLSPMITMNGCGPPNIFANQANRRDDGGSVKQ
jgi:hypothetical protein